MVVQVAENEESLPQLLGEFSPVDVWQRHLNTVFYGLHGDRVQEFYQTFATADYRLGYALAADYVERALQRLRNRPGTMTDPLTIMEWGCGNGNLAACFLDHLQALDRDAVLYPRLQYVLLDASETVLDCARDNADLARHRERVQFVHAAVHDLQSYRDGSVDRIVCNELWSELPTKLLFRKAGDVMEEYIRPNLKETRLEDFPDWAGLIHLFEKADIAGLKRLPAFLEDLVWEREYRAVVAKDMPFRRLVMDFLKLFDEEVLVPVNTGAATVLKEANRLMAPDALGLSGFDAGTMDEAVLNDPDKPCYNVVGGQLSFMVNFALLEDVAKQVGGRVRVEPQKEFVGCNLGANVMSFMDVLASHPAVPRGGQWEVDRLIVQTIEAVNAGGYASPYERTIALPLAPETPDEPRRELERLLAGQPGHGIADTVAYVTEDEVLSVMDQLEALGYERHGIRNALMAPPQSVDYFHFWMGPDDTR